MTRLRALPPLVTVALLLDGCASRAAVPAHVEPLKPLAGAVAGPGDAELRPNMEALLREREAFFASQGDVGVSTSASIAARLRPLPPAGAIATRRVARIDAMAFNGRSGRGPACTAEQQPLAPGGRLCGDVRLPIATLTEAEKARVLRLLEDAEGTGPNAARDGQRRSRPVVRCDFDPHHALVLYDDAARPVGTIAVCMSCHQWLVRPSSLGTGESRAVLLEERERTALAAIFNAHGLGAWIFDEDDPRRREVSAYENAVYGTEAAPTPRGVARRRGRLEANPSGVDRAKKLVDLTRADRDALCAWTSDTVRPGRRHGGGHGYECADGVAWVATYGLSDCGARPLRCQATVGELEACLRELREPEDLCGAPAAACARLMQCLPGIVARPRVAR